MIPSIVTAIALEHGSGTSCVWNVVFPPHLCQKIIRPDHMCGHPDTSKYNYTIVQVYSRITTSWWFNFIHHFHAVMFVI